MRQDSSENSDAHFTASLHSPEVTFEGTVVLPLQLSLKSQADPGILFFKSVRMSIIIHRQKMSRGDTL